MDYQYTYLIWTLLLLLIWISLYLYKKEGRKEMLIISLLFGIGGLLSELVYIQDWWRPITIINTPIGIEDFLFGFSVGGIASAIYSRIFNKKIKKEKVCLPKLKYRYVGILFVLLFFGSFLLFKNSFYSSLLAYTSGIAIMWIKRRDLIFNSVISGILTLIIGTMITIILNIFYPGFIEQFWYLQKEWYSILLLRIPLREYIWYLLTGMFIGPLYEYALGRKLINIKK
jgi:hypothetical protein